MVEDLCYLSRNPLKDQSLHYDIAHNSLQSDFNSLLVNGTESSTPYPNIMSAAPVL